MLNNVKQQEIFFSWRLMNFDPLKNFERRVFEVSRKTDVKSKFLKTKSTEESDVIHNSFFDFACQLRPPGDA